MIPSRDSIDPKGRTPERYRPMSRLTASEYEATLDSLRHLQTHQRILGMATPNIDSALLKLISIRTGLMPGTNGIEFRLINTVQ